MIIKEGTRLKITHSRKGTFEAVAYEDFDSEAEWYSVRVDQKHNVEGVNTEWKNGDVIPCRRSLCTFKILDSPS